MKKKKKQPTKLQHLGLWQQTQAATVVPQNASRSKTSTVPAKRGESDTMACFWISSLFMNMLDIIKKKTIMFLVLWLQRKGGKQSTNIFWKCSILKPVSWLMGAGCPLAQRLGHCRRGHWCWSKGRDQRGDQERHCWGVERRIYNWLQSFRVAAGAK